MNWNDPESFEIRTLSVERQLEQLVKQVTTLVEGKPSNYRKGQSKSGPALLEVSSEEPNLTGGVTCSRFSFS